MFALNTQEYCEIPLNCTVVYTQRNHQTKYEGGIERLHKGDSEAQD